MEVLELFSFLGVDNTALLGLPLRIISTIVIIFVFMGQLLLRSGGSLFFSDLAAALMGRSRGGAGKMGVFASGLFGSISGSAVANVASTGVVTIPLMQKSGYPAHVSGAFIAVASTGGQLMPPVMGAAAFLMAEILLGSGLAGRLYNGVAPFMRRLPGGLMHANVGFCTMFAATSGSSIATAARHRRFRAGPLIDRSRSSSPRARLESRKRSPGTTRLPSRRPPMVTFTMTFNRETSWPGRPIWVG